MTCIAEHYLILLANICSRSRGGAWTFSITDRSHLTRADPHAYLARNFGHWAIFCRSNFSLFPAVLMKTVHSNEVNITLKIRHFNVTLVIVCLLYTSLDEDPLANIHSSGPMLKTTVLRTTCRVYRQREVMDSSLSL